MGSYEFSSFRDPSARVFRDQGLVYRQLHEPYRIHYEKLMGSGLYDTLAGKGWLISHEETSLKVPGAWKVIMPRQLGFISYPHEWSFSQLKDAALLTLRIQKESMKHGMSLKDATGFNIVFESNGPVFIDTSSFELYDESRPWIAYHQFCECFLAPLLLAHYRGTGMLALLAQHPDGIPIPLASALLPFRSRFSMLSLLHIHLQQAVSGTTRKTTNTFSSAKLMRILDHLENGISSLHINKETSTWSRYYADTILSAEYLEDKKAAVREHTANLKPRAVADLGANTGEFAAMFAGEGRMVIAADYDRLCVDRIYKERKDIMALAIDLMYPTPAIGWMNRERLSFPQRIRVDLVLALALMHHLCIARNLSFEMLASGLSELGEYLLMEFVPKDDPKVEILLKHREDIFDTYTEENFRQVFSSHYDLMVEKPLQGSNRKLFLYRRKIRG